MVDKTGREYIVEMIIIWRETANGEGGKKRGGRNGEGAKLTKRDLETHQNRYEGDQAR